MPRITLITGTVGRTEELIRLFDSLVDQNFKDFEVILVDQNEDDRLVPIITEYKESLNIIHFRSKRGLSHARNLGLKHASGEIVCFPDDDCWYFPDVLQRVDQFLITNKNVAGICGRSIGSDGEATAGKFDSNNGWITIYNVWRRAISITIFLYREAVVSTGKFDESLGAGAGTLWGSGEETDYLIRLINNGYDLYFDPALRVGHSNPVAMYDGAAQRRGFLYGAGMGRVLRKHNYPFWFVGYQWIRPLGGAVLALATGNSIKSLYHWATFRGRVRGWLG